MRVSEIRVKRIRVNQGLGVVKSRPNQAERDGISTIYVQNHRRLTVPTLTAILPNFWIFPGPDIPKDYL